MGAHPTPATPLAVLHDALQLQAARSRLPKKARRSRGQLAAFAVVALLTSWGAAALLWAAPRLSSGCVEGEQSIEVLPALDGLLGYLGAPTSTAIRAPAGFTSGAPICLSGGTFMLIEAALLLGLELLPAACSEFVARKVFYAGSGLLFLTLDPRTEAARGATYLIAVASILMTWSVTKALGIPLFRFIAAQDIGMTIFLLITMLWFYLQFPPSALAPMFFADPCGAMVGKLLSQELPRYNLVWYEKKTLGGSIATCMVTLATLVVFYPPMHVFFMVLLSTAASFAEAFGGVYGNLWLAAVVIGGYQLCVTQT